MKSVVLDGFAVDPTEQNWGYLAAYGEYRVYPFCEEENVIERIGDADIVLTNRMHINASVLDACPNVKYVTALGTGYDMIDVDECRKRGVEVCNVPGYSTMSVAQHAFALLFSLVTDINAFNEASHSGKWTGKEGFDYTPLKFMELAGKTIGIYGCGNIGRQLGRICGAFGMRVLGYRRSKQGVTEEGIEYVDLDTLLSSSDFVSFNCPLNDVTRGIVNADMISRMKDGVYIVNTSRGAVINEKDLYDALVSGKVAGAGLDVMASEPPSPSNPLFTCKNCVITPHCAWTSKEARQRLMSVLDENIASFVKTGKGINRVFK